jgi:hypothetical protein
MVDALSETGRRNSHLKNGENVSAVMDHDADA